MKVLLVLLLASALSWRLSQPLSLPPSAEALGERLLLATSTGDEGAMRRAWAAGAPIDYRDGSRSTALTYAALAGDLRTVRWLLERGACANAVTLNGHTPLMAAMGKGEPQLIRALLDRGADVDAKSASGVTALMIAADNGNVAAIRALLERGAERDLCDSTGATAVDHARGAEGQQAAQCVKLLAGARN
jgi:uncharacterized protein